MKCQNAHTAILIVCTLVQTVSREKQREGQENTCSLHGLVNVKVQTA